MTATTSTTHTRTAQSARSRRRRAVGFLGVGALVCAGFAAGSNALFTDSEGTNGNEFTAGTLDLVVGQQASNSINFANLAPGDTERRTIKLSNAGTLDLKYTLDAFSVSGTKGLDRDGVVGANARGIGTQSQNTTGDASATPPTFGQDEKDEDTDGTEFNRDAPGGAYLPLNVTAFLDDNANGVLDADEDTVYTNTNIATGLAAGGGTLAATATAGSAGYLGAQVDQHTYDAGGDIDTAVAASLGAGTKGKTITVIASYPETGANQNAEQGASATFKFGFSAVQVANNTDGGQLPPAPPVATT